MDDTPVVFPITFLKRCGLLKDDRIPIEISFNIPPTTFSITRDGQSIVLEECQGSHAPVEVDWTTSQLKHGDRAYYLSDEGDRFEDIIFWRGEFYAGNAFFEWAEGHSKAMLRRMIRAAKRLPRYWIPAGASKRKITELTRRAWRDLDEEQIERLPIETIKEIERVSRHDMKASQRENWNQRSKGPVYAIEEGGVPSPHLREFLMQTSPEGYRQQCPLPIELLEMSPAHLGNHHMITIGALSGAGLLKPGDLKPFCIGWTLDEDIRESILLVADLRDRDQPMILFEFSSNENLDGTWQRVMIEQLRNKRWYFRCPATNRRCERLYLREGWFASSEAHNLFSSSQYDR